MENVVELLKIFAAILVVIIAIGVTFNILSPAKEGIEQAMDASNQYIEMADDLEYSRYDGTKVSGALVIECIKQYNSNKDIEVCVCTRDGSNLVYNEKTITAPIADTSLVDLPLSNSVGAWTAPVMATTTRDMVGSFGYIPDTSISTPGCINSNGQFVASLQHDANGYVRRITFVQQ